MSLAQKLAEVTAAVRHPPQSGHNKFHRYDYSTRDDIFGAIRGELASRGIVVVPSVEEVIHGDTSRVSKSGAAIVRFNVRVRILITDGDEEYVSLWWGESHTEDDKGIQQAVTQALRFWATNTFMLLDGSDEQLYGQPGTQTTSGGPGGPPNVNREAASSSATEAKSAIAARLKSLGFELDDVKGFFGYIAESDKSPSIDDVHPGKLKVWADRIAKAADEDVKTKVATALKTVGAQEAA